MVLAAHSRCAGYGDSRNTLSTWASSELGALVGGVCRRSMAGLAIGEVATGGGADDAGTGGAVYCIGWIACCGVGCCIGACIGVCTGTCTAGGSCIVAGPGI